MAQTPNQKKPNHSKPPLPKQPNRSNIVTLVVFLAVGIFFAVMMTRTMTATNGVTQTDELVTSEFTQAVEQGRVNTAVYDTGSYTITGTYYPAATAGEATTDAFNTAFNALNSGMASTTGARPTIVQTQELAASKLAPSITTPAHGLAPIRWVSLWQRILPFSTACAWHRLGVPSWHRSCPF